MGWISFNTLLVSVVWMELSLSTSGHNDRFNITLRWSFHYYDTVIPFNIMLHWSIQHHVTYNTMELTALWDQTHPVYSLFLKRHRLKVKTHLLQAAYNLSVIPLRASPSQPSNTHPCMFAQPLLRSAFSHISLTSFPAFVTTLPLLLCLFSKQSVHTYRCLILNYYCKTISFHICILFPGVFSCL